jgi:multidrug efflux pump subunit AcrA (membrane-fusion protein)
VSGPLQGTSQPHEAEREPRWSLRSAEAPLGAAAVAALVAGIGLLARPRPPSPEPVSGGAATPVPVPLEEDVEAVVRPVGELVDLDAARLRRRSG